MTNPRAITLGKEIVKDVIEEAGKIVKTGKTKKAETLLEKKKIPVKIGDRKEVVAEGTESVIKVSKKDFKVVSKIPTISSWLHSVFPFMFFEMFINEKAINVPKLEPDFLTNACEQIIKFAPISSLNLFILLFISSKPLWMVIPRSPSPIFPSAALNSLCEFFASSSNFWKILINTSLLSI